MGIGSAGGDWNVNVGWVESGGGVGSNGTVRHGG